MRRLVLLLLLLPTTVSAAPKDVKLIVLHSLAVTFDGVTTKRAVDLGYHESDPLTRPLVGRYPTYNRMIPLGAAEVVGAAWLAHRHPKMRWLQVGLTVAHFGAGSANLRLR